MATKLTPWMSVATPPLESRPGMYDMRFGWSGGSRIMRREWTGQRWVDSFSSGFTPSAAWGDQWRGIAKG
jgi:hypothetical protein